MGEVVVGRGKMKYTKTKKMKEYVLRFSDWPHISSFFYIIFHFSVPQILFVITCFPIPVIM